MPKRKKPGISPDIPMPRRTPEIIPNREPEKPVIPMEPEIIPEREPEEPNPDEIPKPKREDEK